jgi:prepilin peptidase CpaA
LNDIALAAFALLFCLAMLYGAISDLTRFTIPNSVSYGLILLFIPFAALSLELKVALLHLGLGLVVFVICIVFWQLRMLGGGDVKFLSAASLWMGPVAILPFLVLLCVLSAAFVLVLKQLRLRNDLIQASGWPNIVKNVVQKSSENAVPYGVPIGLSGIAMFLAYAPALNAG